MDENRREHNCNFWLLRGVIADQPAVISGTFYSTRASSAGRGTKPHRTSALAPRDRCPQHKSSNRQGSVLPKQHYTFAEIQNVTSLQFSALLIDCEGCIETAFLGNAEPLSSLLKNVNTVILEADMPLGAADCQQDCVDYAKWVTAFSSAGLNQVQKTQDPVYTKIYHYVFQRTN